MLLMSLHATFAASAAAATGGGCAAEGGAAAPLNLLNASIEVAGSPPFDSRLPVYAKMLSDRVRDAAPGAHWAILDEWQPVAAGVPVVVRLVLDLRYHEPPESYTLAAAGSVVSITAGDERGVLFGVGRLLRLLNCSFHEDYGSKAADAPRSSVYLPLPLNLSSSPDFPMRGHQLGYRPKTNAYDGWDVVQYERYIVDLALFGTRLSVTLLM